MNKTDGFEQFLASQSAQIPAIEFVINLLLTGLFGILIGVMYIKFASSISNRKSFANNIVMISLVTMVVISIVKSSLALSLGLVGALSIVRFRAAIKDPEELTYLFLAISVGLGMGADQFKIVLAAFLVISTIIFLRYKFDNKDQSDANFYLTLSSKNPEQFTLSRVKELLKNNCRNVELKRINKDSNSISFIFYARFLNFDAVDMTRLGVEEIDKDARITFVDNIGINA
ncbi:MAG: DUF4956 domain-containing protein [Sedimenticola sp.]